MPLNPATSERQLCTETQESRTDHEKKCHSQLEAHVEFRWLGYCLQGDVHTTDFIQEVLSTLLIHTSQRLAQESTSNFSLHRYWKVGINLTAKSNNTRTRAASSDSVSPLLLPQTFSCGCSTQPRWAGHYSQANKPSPKQQSSAEDLNGSLQFPLLAGCSGVEPELTQMSNVLVLT